MVHDYGPGRRFASVHVEMDRNLDPLLSHDLIDRMERDFLAEENLQLVIHYDPVLMDDAEWSRMRDFVEKIVREVDPELSFHDFRLVRGACQTKLVFDLAVPYEKCAGRLALRDRIEEKISKINGEYMTVIRFDEA